jgi:ribonuclease E
MANKMLIDATHPEETRVVVLRGNRVEEFDFETAHRKQLRGNIYLAKVTRVEPSLQAAFVEYGGNRHGFLAFSEIHPDYYQIPVADRQALLEAEARAEREQESDEEEANGRRGGRRHRGRHRRHERQHARRDETIQSEPLNGEAIAAEGAPQDTAGSAPGEAHPGDQPAEAHSTEPAQAYPAQAYDAPPAPAAEAANPPVPAEIGTPVENPQPEFAPSPEASAMAKSYTAEQPAGEHHEDERHEGAQSEAARAAENAAHADDSEAHAFAPSEANGQDSQADDANGHAAEAGAEEEEEVVESVGGADAMEEVLDRAPRYRRQYKIQEVIKRRQVMLVQVVKEERGTKGAALTTYLSLAGRYCVLMPNTARGGGISRKITSSDDRKKLREIAEELEVPEGMGVILRTAGAARTKQEVKRDFEYLLRQWELVRDLTLKSTAPTLVYEEGSLAKRSIRDLYSKDIDEIIVAGDQGYREAKDFMRMLMPSHAKNVKLYHDSQPVYTRYGIESQLDAMFSPTVQLRSGGYIVINQTEALVSIDVNSGRSTREHHIEDTALKTNCEAAEEVARQLRLRDLAGLIVIDFIDMDEKRNNRTVERRMKDALRNDRARIQVGRISHFGLLEMSRQRIRTSVLESSTEKCPHCGGTGHVRSVSSVALQLLRAIEETLLKGPTHNLIVRTRPDIALYVLNHKRAHLRGLEERFQVALTVNADEEVGGQIGFTIDRGEQVMSIEQAKAVLAQQANLAPPTLIEEEEPAVEEEFEDEAETETSEARGNAGVTEVDEDRPEAQDGESFQPSHGEGDRENGEQREGGRGRSRRRRRRGRGGRNGEGREGGQHPQPRYEQGAEQPHHADEHGAFAPDHSGGPQPDYAQPQHAQQHEGGEPMPEGRPPQERFGEGHHEGGERHENGDGRARRRRGRRGGRRNRRDREGHPEGGREMSHAAGHEGHQGEFTPAPVQGHDMQYEVHSRPDMDERPQWSPPRETGAPESGFAPRSEPVAEAAPAPQPEPESAAAPRRRSTVREPAPSFSASEPVVTPMPAPQPAPPPPTAAAEPAPADDAGKPRRTGWWAKKLLGGDKG